MGRGHFNYSSEVNYNKIPHPPSKEEEKFLEGVRRIEEKSKNRREMIGIIIGLGSIPFMLGFLIDGCFNEGNIRKNLLNQISIGLGGEPQLKINSLDNKYKKFYEPFQQNYFSYILRT